jgi:hypothetical protein
MDSAILKRPIGIEFPGIISTNTLIALISIPILLTNLFLIAILLLWPTSQSYCCGLENLDPEVRLLLVVAFTGGIGSTVRLLRVIPQDFRKYLDKHLGLVDEKEAPGIIQRGILFYLLRPFLGPPVAVLIYFVLRGGFLGGSEWTGDFTINPFGICGIAGLAGLFADSSVDKFKQVFDVFLGISPEDAKTVRRLLD